MVKTLFYGKSSPEHFRENRIERANLSGVTSLILQSLCRILNSLLISAKRIAHLKKLSQTLNFAKKFCRRAFKVLFLVF